MSYVVRIWLAGARLTSRVLPMLMELANGNLAVTDRLLWTGTNVAALEAFFGQAPKVQYAIVETAVRGTRVLRVCWQTQTHGPIQCADQGAWLVYDGLGTVSPRTRDPMRLTPENQERDEPLERSLPPMKG